MNIAGVCRFSMIGRGDWKAYRNQPDEALASIYAEKSAELFSSERMEARFASFEYLTLASLAGQSDQEFLFLVMASDLMPQEYQVRLKALCDRFPQVVLRFLPPMHVSGAQKLMMDDLGLDFADTLQFRLDDDDCVSREFIRRLRRVGRMNSKQSSFGVSFSQQYYCVTDGPTQGVYNWLSPFFSAGASIRHPRHTVFDYGHYQIPKRMFSVTDPHFPNLVTHRGDNDTPRHAAEILKKRGMFRADREEISSVFERHFPFIDKDGLRRCGLLHLIEPDTHKSAKVRAKAVAS